VARAARREVAQEPWHQRRILAARQADHAELATVIWRGSTVGPNHREQPPIGELPDPRVMRPETARILIESMKDKTTSGLW